MVPTREESDLSKDLLAEIVQIYELFEVALLKIFCEEGFECEESEDYELGDKRPL
jgi:hypothetical protein